MSPLNHIANLNLKSLISLGIVILMITLFFGLRPKGYNFSNNIKFLTGQQGLRFGKFGIAHTNPLQGLAELNVNGEDHFSFEIAFKPTEKKVGGFNFLLSLHGGKDSEQLLIGQWRSWVIAMNGDDYDYSRRIKRVSVDTAQMSQKPIFLSFTTGKEGTRVYFDGHLMRHKKDLKLKIPNQFLTNENNTRLLLGNSVSGKNSWTGEVYGLAIYPYTLPERNILRNYHRWQQNHNFSFAKGDQLLALYLFNERQGTRALDHSGKNNHLEIPKRMRILKKEILSHRFDEIKFNTNFLKDVIVNLLGFIPLGFVLMAIVIGLGDRFQKHPCLITISLCFSTSLLVEILQAWIPSRSSSLLDLSLNTLGAWLGITIYYLNFAPSNVARRRKPHQVP